MTQDAKPLSASDIETLRLFYAQPMFPASRRHISRDIRDLIATIDQQAAEIERLTKCDGSRYVVHIVKPEARDPHRADVPCPLWMHRFCFQMTSTVRQPLLLCEACGWTYAEVIEDVEKGGTCTVGDCSEVRSVGTAVCAGHQTRVT